MIFGYARVSTTDQNLDAQLDALKVAGAERIFQEKITGATRARAELDLMLQHARKDDVVVVTKLDRLARSLSDLIEIVTALKDRGVGFRSLGESIDTTTPTGRLIFHVFGSLAEFERERIVERTREGHAAAQNRGRIGDRPDATSKDQCEEVCRMRELGRPIGEVARLFEVSVSTVRRT